MSDWRDLHVKVSRFCYALKFPHVDVETAKVGQYHTINGQRLIVTKVDRVSGEVTLMRPEDAP